MTPLVFFIQKNLTKNPQVSHKIFWKSKPFPNEVLDRTKSYFFVSLLFLSTTFKSFQKWSNSSFLVSKNATSIANSVDQKPLLHSYLKLNHKWAYFLRPKTLIKVHVVDNFLSLFIIDLTLKARVKMTALQEFPRPHIIVISISYTHTWQKLKYISLHKF
mgnify:CR=1 FL=1